MEEKFTFLEVLEEKVAKIRKLRSDSFSNNFIHSLNQLKSVSYTDLKRFEEKYETILPEEYKAILNKFGNGCFNFLPLELNPKSPHVLEHFQNLKKPFPYKETTEIEDLTEFIAKYRASNKWVSAFINRQKIKRKYIQEHGGETFTQLALFGYDGFYESDDFLKELYQEYLYSENHFNGCLRLFDQYEYDAPYLVVSGSARNEIWQDDRIGGNSIYPELGNNGKKIGLFEWIDNNLDKFLESFI
ncbi:MAG: hypothetical protein KDE26_10035 [Bacteroidetes bacterium]|nr:hypothetical protein [Bacteroidota bacterium]